MKHLKIKFWLIALLGIAVLFFSNNFGLIDIERTAIIAALAIDKTENDEYLLTAQIAVPEANDTNTENQKAQISGKGNTVGSAIKNIGDSSGWFPKLVFCNLLIIGKDLESENVITVLDYFSKTLRVQDSTVVVFSKDKAKDLLEVATPLDKISSFALQKVLLKTPWFNNDIYKNDIKTFCKDYYSVSESSYMPIVKAEKQQASNGGSGNESSGGGSGGSSSGSSGSDKDNYVFNATNTALFFKGMKVGELNADETLIYNVFKNHFNGTTLEINNVKVKDSTDNYLLTVIDSKSNIDVYEKNGKIKLDIKVKMYCKVSDQNSTASDSAYEKNKPLPYEVKLKTKEYVEEQITSLIKKQKETECDVFRVKEKMYRHHHDEYILYGNDYLSLLESKIEVDIQGQK